MHFIKKKEIIITNKSNVTKVCIDDFAIKKGEKYGTVMIDINTHKIIDIIDSPDHDKVTSWLRKFPNLQIVSRDGSITYKKAITDSHEKATQVTDRFHLLKNLTTYCKNFLTKYLSPKIKIELSANNLNNSIASSYELFSKQPLKERYQYAMELYHNSVNKSTCCKLCNIDIRLFNKLLSLNDDAKLEYFKTKKEILHNQKVVEKEEKIKLVREMHKAQYSIRAISRELHMARETVSKYLKPDVSVVHACHGIKKDGGILLPYKDKINEYFSKRFNFKDIEANIRLQGYKGSISLLRKYVASLKLDTKLQYEKYKSNNKNVIYIERKLIMKLLYKPLDKVKELDKSLFQLLCEQYPHVNEILDIVNNFRDILKSKKISKLDTWIENTFNLGISELKSFINGLNQDIEAVRNSISLEYNNGLAEGSVNKIKVIKRIMYGRCNFETLRNKIIKLENLK